jgi:hypothetical protein
VAAWVVIWIVWAGRNRLPPANREKLKLEEGPRWRGFLKTTLVISILGSFRVHDCYHATTIWLGPFPGLSYSDKGGPCGNDPHHGGQRLIGNFYIANP